uniref:Prostaglandin reductase 1 n=1 Tax=Culicoides sonorensis TaxID=179676 RepID=A0A336LLS4_CULSO
MVKAKTWIKANEWTGVPKFEDLKLSEVDLPELKDREVLVEAEYLSVDPYHWAFSLTPGNVMIGGQVAKVIESKNEKFTVGSYLYGHFGWRTHTIFNPDVKDIFGEPYLLPDWSPLPRSLGLGVLGMPGNTAYFGFLELCQPKAGETLLVNAAGGAVGSLVGQIGKLKGLKVIGIAGTDAKCEWITKELGFDHAINYKTQDVATELDKVAPNGIDCYFDNVGGEQSSIIFEKMNQFGRISVCGSISCYGSLVTGPKTYVKVPAVQPMFVFKQLKMEGFIVSRWLDRWMEGIMQMADWIKEGKIKYHETITEGFEKMPEAFIGMLNGSNTGKAVIKV